MDKRVILICNFVEKKDQGILKTLGREYRRSPFVQTHLYGYNGTAYIRKITPGSPYLYLRQDSVSTKLIRDWRVLLIADCIPAKSYPPNIFDPDTLVMYHTKPSDVAVILNNKIVPANKRRGYHEKGEDKGYPLLNRLVAAYESGGKFKETDFNDAVDALIGWFGVNEVLEAKLNLLHECLGGVPGSIDASLAAEFRASFEVFRKKAAHKKWPDEDYMLALTELRRSLLGS